MATYMDGTDGGKHNSDNIEASFTPKKKIDLIKRKYGSKMEKVRLDALKYIREIVSKRGDNPYELIDPSTYEDEIEDEVYELPRGINVDKRGYHEEYPLINVSIINDVLSFEGLSCISETDEDKMFSDDDLDTDVICIIADIIINLEK